MSKTDPYFQFPIAMLRGAKNTSAIVHSVIDYGIWHFALSLHEDHSESVRPLAEQYLSTPKSLSGLDQRNYEHLLLLAACQRLNVALSNVPGTWKSAIATHTRYGTRGAQVRIRNDYAWSAINDEWPLLKFRVLCGVIAGIGNKRLCRLNHRIIQALGAGYDSPRGLNDSDLLPKSSVRYWIDQLWFKNLFQLCKRGHETWYSISQPDDEALAALVKKLPVVPVKSKIDVNDVLPH